MITLISEFKALNASTGKLLEEEPIDIHWGWWVFSVLFFIPAIFALIIITITNKKYLVDLLDKEGEVVYHGYISKDIMNHIRLQTKLKKENS